MINIDFLTYIAEIIRSLRVCWLRRRPRKKKKKLLDFEISHVHRRNVCSRGKRANCYGFQTNDLYYEQNDT